MDLAATTSLVRSQSSGRELQHYVRLLRKRWRLVLTILLVSLSSALVYTARQPRTYEATCSLVIESTAPQVLENVKDVIEMAASSREFYTTQYRIIRSYEIAQRVIDRLGLEHDPAYGGSIDATLRVDRQVVVDRLLRAVKAIGVRESRIANIVVR